MKSITEEWLRRVDAEYRSAAMAQNYTLWLIQAGASPDLIRDGLRIVEDELSHAELSYQVYGEAGGEGAPTLDRNTLGLRRQSESLEEDLLRVAVSFFCLGETVAVPLFQRMRAGCTQDSARRALDRILVDEVRHRDFGWTLLDWLLGSARGPTLRRLLEEKLPGMLDELVESYSIEGHGVSEEERAWGLIAGPDYAEVLQRSLERDYQPRFARVGIDIAER